MGSGIFKTPRRAQSTQKILPRWLYNNISHDSIGDAFHQVDITQAACHSLGTVGLYYNVVITFLVRAVSHLSFNVPLVLLRFTFPTASRGVVRSSSCIPSRGGSQLLLRGFLPCLSCRSCFSRTSGRMSPFCGRSSRTA